MARLYCCGTEDVEKRPEHCFQVGPLPVQEAEQVKNRADIS